MILALSFFFEYKKQNIGTRILSQRTSLGADELNHNGAHPNDLITRTRTSTYMYYIFIFV